MNVFCTHPVVSIPFHSCPVPVGILDTNLDDSILEIVNFGFGFAKKQKKKKR